MVPGFWPAKMGIEPLYGDPSSGFDCTSIAALRPRYDFARNRAPSSISAMPRESEDVKLGVGIGWTLKG